jgi:hypothetical protein
VGEKWNTYRVLVEKSEGKTPLERPKHRWEGNNKMGLRELEWGDMDWIWPRIATGGGLL